MYTHQNLMDLPDGDNPKKFETKIAQSYMLLVGGLLLLAGGVITFPGWQQGLFQGQLGRIPLLMLVLGLLVTGMQLINVFAPVRVQLTSDGFECRGQEIRWDEVTAVWEQRNPSSQACNLTIWVGCGERTIRLSSFRLSNLPRLLAVIHQNTLPRLIAEARRAVERGESVSFGPIELDATGLRARGRVLAWDDLERVTPDEAGDLGIWALGRKRPWLDVATGKVDNVRVFLELIEEFSPKPGEAMQEIRLG